MKNQLICICGPTACGKTALSVALARKRNTEIISADSMQLYRKLDIATAKPTEAERQCVPHHLIDVAAPDEAFSVARYVELADASAQELLSGGKIPIVVGGTGLYMDALIECNTFSGNEIDHTLREKYEGIAREDGNEAVHELLRKVDPIAAERLHPNNLKRVIRALEVYHQTGMTLDALNAQNKRPKSKYQAFQIGLCPQDREVLYERIDKRVDQMLADGLLSETERLLKANQIVGTAAQAIGYKEIIPFFTENVPLEQCIDTLKQHTRNYAKRQLTWLKRNPNIFWIMYEKDVLLDELLQRSTRFLQSCGV